MKPSALEDLSQAGPQPGPVPEAQGSTVVSVLLILAVAVALFGIRLTGLPNFHDNEFRLGACVLDAVQNGNWICPHDSLGNTDKPPMLTWLAALVTWPLGELSRFTLYFPTALATLALSLIIFFTGRHFFGWRAGLFGALAYLLSDVGARQMATARWDGLFSLPVTLGVLAGFRAWQLARGWTWFWLACAAATLTKGPLGLLLAGLGLLAYPWERLTRHPLLLRGRQLPGILLFFGLSGGWLLLAYWQEGPGLVNNLIMTELVAHAVPSETMPMAGRWLKPLLNFLSNFAPWSLLALFGFARLCVRPAARDALRRFERFLFCFFVGGLLVFSVAPHNPARILYPIIPAAALIAGSVMGRLAGRLKPSACLGISAGLAFLFLGFFGIQYHWLIRKDRHVRTTVAFKNFARTISQQVGPAFPLTHVDSPYDLQLWFNTLRPNASSTQAVELLRQEVPAWVVCANPAMLTAQVESSGHTLYELARCDLPDQSSLFLVSNHPRLEQTPHQAAWIGPWLIQLDDLQLEQATDQKLVCWEKTLGAGVTLSNRSPQSHKITIRIRSPSGSHREQIELRPGESRRISR